MLGFVRGIPLACSYPARGRSPGGRIEMKPKVRPKKIATLLKETVAHWFG